MPKNWPTPMKVGDVFDPNTGAHLQIENPMWYKEEVNTRRCRKCDRELKAREKNLCTKCDR